MARPFSGDMAPVLIALGATVTVADRDGEADRPMADIFTDDGARLEHGAVQCGYCTPGWLLSAKALLDENPNPTPENVTVVIAGNFCRCTGYQKIIASILAVSGQKYPVAS